VYFKICLLFQRQSSAPSLQLASEKFALLEAHQERNDLRGKIVESPEKLQRTLEELGAAVEKERAAIGEAERRARDLQAKLECCSKAEREVQKTVKLMEEAEAEVIII
jgi:kinetochore protein Nuf2